METYRYSPLAASEYVIATLPACEVSSIISYGGNESIAAWNLFWLSVPGVDALPEHGKSWRWFKHYSTIEGALRAIRIDVSTDPVMRGKLLMHPIRFLEWFRREEHDIFDCYSALGGKEWVETVTRRAEEAALRMSNALPDYMQGKNIYAFIQRPRKHDPLRDGPSTLQIPDEDQSASPAG